MRILVIFLVVLTLGLTSVQAAEIFDTQVLINQETQEGVLFTSIWGPHSDSASWTHTLENLDTLSTIDSATLTLEGVDIIDAGDIEVFFENEHIGTITFGGFDFTETINIPTNLIADSPDNVFDGQATLTFTHDGWLDVIDVAGLLKSTLTVSGNPAPAPVPVPGAIVLAGLGSIVVGRMKRRFN